MESFHRGNVLGLRAALSVDDSAAFVAFFAESDLAQILLYRECGPGAPKRRTAATLV